MKKLAAWYGSFKTKTAAGKSIGVNYQFIDQILAGERTPSPRVQEAMGYQLQREVTVKDRYIEIDNEAS